ncbi:MAG: glycine cleavage system aminomethyltransferase GcvT, partial [Allgaiera sp.]|nr:glycine cleavage system aminomethyltransferase GcvT [Allgaiera sp.]
RILTELAEGPARLRVGLLPEGRAPKREGVALFAASEGGEAIGHVTSGGFGPSLEAPVAMGYLPAGFFTKDTVVYGDVRGRRLPVRVSDMPFRPATYKR